jgi:hypothetical protein
MNFIENMKYFAEQKTCGDAKTYFDWQCNTSASGGVIGSLAANIFNWFSAGVVLIIIIVIIVAGIQYSTAGGKASKGDTSQAKTAIGMIKNAVIALICYAAFWSILKFLGVGGTWAS